MTSSIGRRFLYYIIHINFLFQKNTVKVAEKGFIKYNIYLLLMSGLW